MNLPVPGVADVVGESAETVPPSHSSSLSELQPGAAREVGETLAAGAAGRAVTDDAHMTPTHVSMTHQPTNHTSIPALPKSAGSREHFL
jgi:hypothetical protein